MSDENPPQRKSRKTTLSDNVNTTRERQRRANMDDAQLEADNARRADNAARTRARAQVKALKGFDQLSEVEKEEKISAAIKKIVSKR